MAKGLPYLKFYPADWLSGGVSRLPFEVQGLFISVCALYWHKGGNLTVEDINFYFNKPNALGSLTERLIKITDGKIVIKWLDEQLVVRGHVSATNSVNGSKGGRPKKGTTTKGKANAKRNKSERLAKKSQLELELEEETELELKEVLTTFVRYREEDKKDSMSVLALKLLKTKLTELAGNDVKLKVKLLNHAITSGWKTVYEFKNTNGQTEKPKPKFNPVTPLSDLPEIY